MSASSSGDSTMSKSIDEVLGWVYRTSPTTLVVNEASNPRLFEGIKRVALSGPTVRTSVHECAPQLHPAALGERLIPRG